MSTTAFITTASQLREDILHGRLRAGDRLKLADLARRYRTGYMPVREALRELQGQRLVEMSPNCGARVRGVDVQRVRNMFDVRIALEAMLARRAAERIRPSDIDRLHTVQKKLELSVQRHEYRAALVANHDFHRLVGEVADNDEALDILDMQWRLIPALWRSVGYARARFAAVISDHRQIIEALARRDQEASADITMSHAARARNDLLACLEDRAFSSSAK
ncbi:MAG: GntR family transcriptional regulator [Betaproteobacteria bacterium]|nr:GntR family transcriptional regulator [Betaproteobacteria bacterium]MBA3777040.1 GntR family transcriptional regulator [Betaproteobacteria bacterium]